MDRLVGWSVVVLNLMAASALAMYVARGEASATVAAWVQAVGSILAIAGTAYGVHRQNRAALRAIAAAQLLKDQRMREAILAVAESAREKAATYCAALNMARPREEAGRVFNQLIVDTLVAALTAAPVHELRSKAGVTAYLALRDQFVLLGNALRIYCAGPFQQENVAVSLEFQAMKYGRDNEKFTNMYRTIDQALEGNVRVHLREIEARFSDLKTAVGDADVAPSL